VHVRVVGGSSIDDALMDRAAVLVSDLNVGSDRSRTSA
jgi:hypothetical protein